MTTKVVLIAGPTASGKSALALEAAEQFGGVIINVDSMQVYRDLRIITARPTVDDEKRRPHKLYGHVDAAENYSVGRWCGDVEAALGDIIAQGRVPVLVGGTGLYFKALTTGLAAVPSIPEAIRAEVRRRDLLVETDRFTSALTAEVGEPGPRERTRAKALAERIAKHVARKAG